MPQMAPRNRQVSWMTYVIVAVIIYVAYMIITSKPRPAMNFPPPGPGKLPVMDFDESPEVKVDPFLSDDLQSDAKLQAGPKTKEAPASLTPDQKRIVLEVLPNMARIVHLDLKGAAPKISYLEKLLPLLKTLGATGLLIEWEDMFPYSGELETLAATDCYSKDDVKRIWALAKENDMVVIPLIQTFGHMEFVLKGRKFKHLREHPEQPQVINPHKEESLKLIQDMIDQQLLLQPDTKQFHIGSDEVWGLGNSPESKKQMETYGMSKEVIFLNHVREVAGYIKNTYPNVEIMMWDDMFRSASIKEIERSKVNKLVSPVVWKYSKDVDKFFKPSLWQKYGKLFRNIWIGTAFKGATGSDQFLTDISFHYENHMGWLKILSTISSTMNVKGTIFTGWQRFDHFGALCELLPVGIPSLAICLSAMQKAGVTKTDLTHINSVLGCQQEAPIQWSFDKRDKPPPNCTYPGHMMLEGVYALKNAYFYINFFDSKQSLAGWHKSYNMERNFAQNSRMHYLQEKCTKALNHMANAETIMRAELPLIFSEETLVEWVEINIKPQKAALVAKSDQVAKALSVDTWPRRPIHKLP